MITDFNHVEDIFKEINKVMLKKVNVFVIGGAALLHQGLKPATKDIDIVVYTKEEFIEFQKALEKLSFKPKIPGREYTHMNISQIFQKGDFRIDLFEKEVCGRFSLTKEMMQRAKNIIDLDHITVSLCSNEDIFLFKTMTERDGDLDDCMRLVEPGIEWKIILQELQDQIKQSKQNVWITWVGERLDILEDKGLVIPIMNELNKLRNKFFDDIEKRRTAGL